MPRVCGGRAVASLSPDDGGEWQWRRERPREVSYRSSVSVGNCCTPILPGVPGFQDSWNILFFPVNSNGTSIH